MHFKICIFKGGVAQAETKLEPRSDVLGIEPAVIDQQALAVGNLRNGIGRRIQDVSTIIFALFCNGVREATRWVIVAVEYISQRVAYILVRVTPNYHWEKYKPDSWPGRPAQTIAVTKDNGKHPS